MMVQEPQNSPKAQEPALKDDVSILLVDQGSVYHEYHFDIEGLPVRPPYRAPNPHVIPIQKVGAAPTSPNQSLGLPDGVLTEPVTKTNQPKPAKPKEPIKTQPGLASQVLKGIGSFAWDALDLANGVAKGVIASVTYGTVSGALPHSTDSVTNRVGQVLGTTAVELVGAFLATTGGGAAGGGLIATATGVGALVGIPAVVVGAGINTAGAILIGGASANAGRLYNAPPPQYMMSESSENLGGSGTNPNPNPETGGATTEGPSSVTGETDATAIGKKYHADEAAYRRSTGEFSSVNSPITTKEGDPILVPKRVDLKTGAPQPGKPLQEAIPDAVIYEKGLIIDDKPLGRPIAKDRQEIIRFIKSYERREGHLPETIAIQRYDPKTGKPVVTELYKPEDFLPKK